MTTFADLGIPFPLFEAPTSETSDYVGLATCHLCGGKDRHCFEVDDLIVPCPACGDENIHITDGRRDLANSCRSCDSPIPCPKLAVAEGPVLVCYDCFRAGKAAITKATEFGIVGPEEAFEGGAGGVPGLETDQFEMVRVDPDDDDGDDGCAVRIPTEHMWELLRTPLFLSWQQECWLFCCKKPMTYVGRWENVMKSLRPDNPRAFYLDLFGPDDEERGWIGEDFDGDVGGMSLYIYQCKSCHRFRATHDAS